MSYARRNLESRLRLMLRKKAIYQRCELLLLLTTTFEILQIQYGILQSIQLQLSGDGRCIPKPFVSLDSALATASGASSNLQEGCFAQL